MPVERVSRRFKDISLSFKPHPVTRDIIPLNNASAISRSVKNLVLTNLQERPFQPNLGSRLNGSLFDLMDVGTASIIADEIRSTIDNYEPRVDLIDVEVTPYYDSNEFDCTLIYEIIGVDLPTQTLNFILESFR